MQNYIQDMQNETINALENSAKNIEEENIPFSSREIL